MLSLALLLTACESRTKTTVTEVLVKLPPSGLIEPCYKPTVIGTWPEVVTDDIPNLKVALRECAKQPDEYFKWRAMHEQETQQ